MNVSSDTIALLAAMVVVATVGQRAVRALAETEPLPSVVLNADFEGEPVGLAPRGWTTYTTDTHSNSDT